MHTALRPRRRTRFGRSRRLLGVLGLGLAFALSVGQIPAMASPVDWHVRASFGNGWQEGSYGYMRVFNASVVAEKVQSLGVKYSDDNWAEVGWVEFYPYLGTLYAFRAWSTPDWGYDDDYPATLAADTDHSFSVRSVSSSSEYWRFGKDGSTMGSDLYLPDLEYGREITNSERADTQDNNWGHYWTLKYFDTSDGAWHLSTALGPLFDDNDTVYDNDKISNYEVYCRIP